MSKPKPKTIDCFFKRKETTSTVSQPIEPRSISNIGTLLEQPPSKVPRIDHEKIDIVISNVDSLPEQPPSKAPRMDHGKIDIGSLVRDPGLRPQMQNYPANQQDEIRRAYITFGPYRDLPDGFSYPFSGSKKHPRRFNKDWLKKFPWLEYSPTKDAAYCLPCYIFPQNSHGRFGCDAFTATGFSNWKKASGGKESALLSHVGTNPNSPHNMAVKCYEDLKNQACHIERVVLKHTSQQIQDNRLQLKASIDVAQWLSFQGCAFRGHDEHPDSKNRGNFLELLELLGSYNPEVNNVILQNAPQNAKYTSPTIQKEILHVYARNVQSAIRSEIGIAKFSLMVDEALDESKKEQMAVVVRFVDVEGFVRERFLDLVHVKDTSALTLKSDICACLSHHNLHIQNMRGQGYDGASNMRGEWNGLQALFLKECPYAYYVHCLAHQLQLALIAAAREVAEVHNFFQNLNFIVNIASASFKRNDEVQANQMEEIAHLIEIDELNTGRGANQIGTLQRPGDTRWSSHFKSICSLVRMYSAVCKVLQKVATEGSTYSQRGDATFAVKLLLSFNFVFVLHVMKEIMGITDLLCQNLQLKSQDILNAMQLVSSTKLLIQKLRDDGWKDLLESVISFCRQKSIEVPDMNTSFSDIIRSRRNKDIVTVEHHYRVDVFTVAIDHQLQELNNRFSEQTTELLILSTALDPRDSFKSFKVDDICTLVDKYYPGDFSDQERVLLRYQLQHYKLDVSQHPYFQNVSTIADLCRGLVETRKSEAYPLIDRLIRLVLTLPVSTATTERAFSAMKIVKTRLRSRMNDEFLRDSLILNIEREVAEKFTVDQIIDDFSLMKERRAAL